MNSTYQRNQENPVSHEGEYSVDVLAQKTYDFLENAVDGGKPFFLGVAPVAPHGNVQADPGIAGSEDMWGTASSAPKVHFSAPVAAERHKDLFSDAKVPRTDNFNPNAPSGANWVRTLRRQSQENVDYNDHFYRQRLRALQSVDELVDGIVARLEDRGVLQNTYIVYTSDNGYHIGQHRLPPGKECGYEEDVNVPLIVRGPGVPRNRTTGVVTTHTDLAPTILELAGVGPAPDVEFDGEKIPLDAEELTSAARSRHEHVNIEYWGFALAEGRQFPGQDFYWLNNTYKALRIAGDSWDLYYSVWCNGEHELYDMKVSLNKARPKLPKPTEDQTDKILVPCNTDRSGPTAQSTFRRNQPSSSSRHHDPGIPHPEGGYAPRFPTVRSQVMQGPKLHSALERPAPGRQCREA